MMRMKASGIIEGVGSRIASTSSIRSSAKIADGLHLSNENSSLNDREGSRAAETHRSRLKIAS
jgi:hypothetical protein